MRINESPGACRPGWNLAVCLAAAAGCVAVALPARTRAAVAPRYTIAALGTFGGHHGAANGINDPGQVVGWSETGKRSPADNSLLFNAFLRSPSGSTKLKNLGTLGGENSESKAINGDGKIVGYAENGAIGPTGIFENHAFLWTPGGTDGVASNRQMKDLGTLGGPSSYAYGINADGLVVGDADIGQTATDGSQIFHACVWRGGLIRALPGLGGSDSAALAVNDNGTIVGYAETGKVSNHLFTYHACLWDGPDAQKAHDLGTLGGTLSKAYGINSDGKVVGEAQTKQGVAFHAFLYNGAPPLVLLQKPMQGTSVGRSINASGVIVGETVPPKGPSTAVLLKKGLKTNLFPLVPHHGWKRLNIARGVNATGQIAGAGIITSGDEQPYLVTPK